MLEIYMYIIIILANNVPCQVNIYLLYSLFTIQERIR